MRKKRINQLIKDNSVFLAGVITAVNSDGTYTVNITGRSQNFTRVKSATHAEYLVGDFVTLARVQGSNQALSIISSGTYGADSSINEQTHDF